MRLFRLLPWFLLPSLVLSADCDWKMPVDVPKCEQKIRWKCHNNKQATSTCLEYFPTTFVEGIINPSDNKEIICTVHRQFQCNFKADTFSMFDKCYKFLKAEGEKTMVDYLKNRDTLCENDGGLPVVFSMSQLKHIGKQAHRLGINKMWVNVDREGRTIDKSSLDIGHLLYKDQWKLHKDAYWDGEELKMADKAEGGEYTTPATAKYLFFRTRTDHLNNLWQGSFERATETATASVVCAYDAKIVPDQEKYCEKLKALGLNAKYDERNNRKRCVYTSLTSTTMKGTVEDIRRIQEKICSEKPSTEHSSGLDDGTASRAVYTELAAKGTYRVAAIKIDTNVNTASKHFAKDIRKHCDESYTRDDIRKLQRQPYQIYDHFDNKDFSSKMQAEWADGYPKDECSDFPDQKDMHSNTLAISKGKIIDVPVSVPYPVLCSIETQVDCGRMKKANTPICKADEICINEASWNVDKNYFASCRCPKFHHLDETDGVCKWHEQYGDGNCGQLHRWSSGHAGWRTIPRDKWSNLHKYDNGQGFLGDQVDLAVVRNGCKMSVWSHPNQNGHNYPLLTDLTTGEYNVPLHSTNTLSGWAAGMAASGVQCTCDRDAPLYKPQG